MLDRDRAGAVEVELAVGAVSRPAGLGQEAPYVVVAGHRPADRPLEPVGGERVDRGLEQPRAVAVPAVVGVDRQLHQLPVGDRVGVGVGGGGGDGEADHPVALQRHQNPDPGVRRAAEHLPPRLLGDLRVGVQLLGREQVGEVVPPGAQLEPGDRRRVVGPRHAARDVRGGGGHAHHPGTRTLRVTPRRQKCRHL
jgi:hypothetical protein